MAGIVQGSRRRSSAASLAAPLCARWVLRQGCACLAAKASPHAGDRRPPGPFPCVGASPGIEANGSCAKGEVVTPHRDRGQDAGMSGTVAVLVVERVTQVEFLVEAGKVAGSIVAVAALVGLLGSTCRGINGRVKRIRTVWELFLRPSRPSWDDVVALPDRVVSLARGDRMWPRWWCLMVASSAVCWTK